MANTITVTIDGTVYTFDQEKAKQLGLLKESVQRKVGLKYTYTADGTEFMLVRCQLAGARQQYVVLVSPIGTPWTDATPVIDTGNINDDEWNKVTGEYVFKVVTK